MPRSLSILDSPSLETQLVPSLKHPSSFEEQVSQNFLTRTLTGVLCSFVPNHKMSELNRYIFSVCGVPEATENGYRNVQTIFVGRPDDFSGQLVLPKTVTKHLHPKHLHDGLCLWQFDLRLFDDNDEKPSWHIGKDEKKLQLDHFSYLSQFFCKCHYVLDSTSLETIDNNKLWVLSLHFQALALRPET